MKKKTVPGTCFKLTKRAWQQQYRHSAWTLSEGDPELALMQWTENKALNSHEPHFLEEVIQIPK